jgi:hypothetical protein
MAAALTGWAGVGAVRAAEDDIFVSDVLLEGDMASVTLNDALQVREIKLTKVGEKTSLRFPEYVSKRGKAYPQVTVHSKKAYDNILESVSSGQPSKEKAKSIKFRVGEPQILSSPTRRANCEITFNDAVSITVGVLKSKREGGNPYWLGYPGRRDEASGKYVNQVVITNPKLKKAVEEAVLEKFQRVAGERGGDAAADEGGGGQE